VGRTFSSCVAAPLAAEKVDALVIRDAKEPRLEARWVLECRETVERFRQGLLNEVLAIEQSTAHARAESVQPRPHGAGGGHELLSRLEHRVANVGRQVGLALWRRGHVRMTKVGTPKDTPPGRSRHGRILSRGETDISR